MLNAAGWKEISGSPTFCNDDSALGIQQMADLMTGNPNLASIVLVGGWPLFTQNAYDAFYAKHKAAIDSGKLTIVSADTLPAELAELKAGEVAALVGQQPYAMGAKAMDILLALEGGQDRGAHPVCWPGCRDQGQCGSVHEVRPARGVTRVKASGDPVLAFGRGPSTFG